MIALNFSLKTSDSFYRTGNNGLELPSVCSKGLRELFDGRALPENIRIQATNKRPGRNRQEWKKVILITTFKGEPSYVVMYFEKPDGSNIDVAHPRLCDYILNQGLAQREEGKSAIWVRVTPIS